MNIIDRILRKINFYSGLTNIPFLSGDSFSTLCDVTINSLPLTQNIESELGGAHSVFIRSDFLIDFLKLLPSFPNVNTVVAGNSDTNFSALVFPEDLSIRLYCQNFAGSQSAKVSLLPLGLENLKLAGSGQPKYFRSTKPALIVDKVLIPPHGNTNSSRREQIHELKRNNIFVVTQKPLSRKHYFEKTSNYRFILCLEGNGFDTHRVWETLYQNSFPVIQNSAWAENLKNLGLPILFVDDLNSLDSAILHQHYTRYSDFNARNWDCLWIPFWEKKFSERVSS